MKDRLLSLRLVQSGSAAQEETATVRETPVFPYDDDNGL